MLQLSVAHARQFVAQNLAKRQFRLHLKCRIFSGETQIITKIFQTDHDCVCKWSEIKQNSGVVHTITNNRLSSCCSRGHARSPTDNRLRSETPRRWIHLVREQRRLLRRTRSRLALVKRVLRSQHATFLYLLRNRRRCDIHLVTSAFNKRVCMHFASISIPWDHYERVWREQQTAAVGENQFAEHQVR